MYTSMSLMIDNRHLVLWSFPVWISFSVEGLFNSLAHMHVNVLCIHYVCAHIYVCTHAFVCVCMQSPGVKVGSPHLVFWGRISRLTLELTNVPWLANHGVPGPTCFCLSGARTIDPHCCVQFPMWTLGIHIRSACLCGKHFTDWALLSPQIFYLFWWHAVGLLFIIESPEFVIVSDFSPLVIFSWKALSAPSCDIGDTWNVSEVSSPWPCSSIS